MRMGPRRSWWSAIFISIFVLAAGSVTSYIDAGSGSYIFQLLIGAVAGAAMGVGVFWRRIRAAVGRMFSRRG